MKNCFAGKWYVIAGATSGVGGSIVRRLAEKGASFLLLGRNREKLDSLADVLVDVDFETGPLDLEVDSIEAAIKASMEDCVKKRGIQGFSGGVYCAGIAPSYALRGTGQAMVEDLMRVNFTGAVLFSKLLASKRLRNPEHGVSIVHIASIRAMQGEVGLGLYGASKAALVALSKALARELAPSGCRINCISPGWLDTEMNRLSEAHAPGLMDRMRERHPLGLGMASDAASAALFLLSEESRWITGTNLVVDGGFIA